MFPCLGVPDGMIDAVVTVKIYGADCILRENVVVSNTVSVRELVDSADMCVRSEDIRPGRVSAHMNGLPLSKDELDKPLSEIVGADNHVLIVLVIKEGF